MRVTIKKNGSGRRGRGGVGYGGGGCVGRGGSSTTGEWGIKMVSPPPPLTQPIPSFYQLLRL